VGASGRGNLPYSVLNDIGLLPFHSSIMRGKILLFLSVLE